LRPLRVARAPRWCEGEESLLAVHVRGRGRVRRLARALGPFTATRLFSNERGDLRQWIRYPQTTDGRTVPDANELKLLASRQEQAFHEKFGYPSREVPDIWVGQNVAVNMLGGRGADRQLAPTRASGMLEAIRDDGFVISVEDRVVFIPRSAVLQMELHETRGRGRRLRLEQ
jgi:hypothetical protein